MAGKESRKRLHSEHPATRRELGMSRFARGDKNRVRTNRGITYNRVYRRLSPTRRDTARQYCSNDLTSRLNVLHAAQVKLGNSYSVIHIRAEGRPYLAIDGIVHLRRGFQRKLSTRFNIHFIRDGRHKRIA